MKNPKEIPRQSAIPKKGTPYIWEDKEVWLYHVRSSEIYVVSTDKGYKHPDDLHPVHPDELSPVRKIGTPIQSRPKPKTDEEKAHQEKVNQFFIRAAIDGPKISQGKCQNCGHPLGCYTLEDWRCATAHILPKSITQGFPTVAYNDHNKMYLGPNCGCHDKWDNAKASERVEMNCYPLAILGYNQFKNELTDKEAVKAEKYLHINP